MDKQYTRAELALIRAKCDNDLLYFTRFFYKLLRGSKFIISEHHRTLSNHFDDVSNYKVKLLNINIPPRHSKTELALNYIARGIGINPASNWLYISASDELRSEASVRIRDIISHPLFKKMYNIELKKDQNSKNIWKTTQGGGLKTATIFGQVTGFGAGQMTEAGFNSDTVDLIRDFEGCQVWDDLNKTEDSERENANNDKVSRVIFNTLLSRENSHDTPIIHIQQRTGLSDATASLMEHYGLENDSFRFVIMPIIKEDGTPLWASKFPIEKIIELKTSEKTSHMFESQYMQNPQPSKGALFRGDELQYFNIDQLHQDKVEIRVGAIDVADTGKDHLSFPSGCIIGDKVYITDWIYSQENTDVTKPQIMQMINVNEIEHTLVETNSFGKEYYKSLTYEAKTGCNIYGKFTRDNKHHKILKYAQFIKNRFVFRTDIHPNSEYAKAMQHLKRYMKDGSFSVDDPPDSLTLLVQMLKLLELERFV